MSVEAVGLAVHLAVTAMMTGLVLFVGVVHYPLMAKVGEGEVFARYAREHARRTTWVVGPLMLVEAVMTVWVVALGLGGWLGWAGAGLLAVCWGVTFGVSVKQHAQLAGGFDARVHAGLVKWHWVRTAAWCGRVVIAGMQMAKWANG